MRVDVWLWAVRVFRTRSSANDACKAGKVRVDGAPAKPSTKVSVGSMVSARRGGDRIEYEVVELASKRVGAALAGGHFIDLSPPPVPATDSRARPAPVAQRERGAGRPTKRDRRRLDRLADRDH